MTDDLAGDRVSLRLPAASAYLSVLRTATASLASRADLTLDDIEDLRIAVDEACALLLPHAPEDAEFDCVFTLRPGSFAVSITVPSVDTAELARDSFAWTVLTALAGEVSSTVSEGRLTLSLAKHKVAPE